MTGIGIIEVPETQEEGNEWLLNRMQELVSSLHVIKHMNRCGAVLPEDYRREQFPPIRRFAERVLAALEAGEPTRNPWDQP